MVLHGWKQIAQYLGCGIRTAQRWESQCNLPVNRPRNHLRSPVLAQSEALDAWAAGASAAVPAPWEGRVEELHQQIEELKRELANIAARAPANSPRVSVADHDASAVAQTRARQLAAKTPGFEA